MNAYAKIRAALEMSKSASRYCVLPGLERKTDEALAELADLERRASRPLGTMASGGSARGRPFTVFTSFDIPPGTPVYSAPPVPAGVFTAEQMRAAYDEGQSNKYGPWLYSDTFKLIQERTK